MKLLPAPLSINSIVSPMETNQQQHNVDGMSNASVPHMNNSDLMWRFPFQFPLTPQTPTSPFPLSDFNNHLPNGLTQDPRAWSHQDVVSFLKWCQREFDLRPFDTDKFQLNGKALCLLTKTDLCERAPNAGDVVYNVLQLLIRDSQSLQRSLPSSPITPTTRYAYSYPVSHWPFVQHSIDSFHSNLSISSASSTPSSNSAIHQFFQNSVVLTPSPSMDSQVGSPRNTDNSQVTQVLPISANVTATAVNATSDSEDDSDQDNLKIRTSPPTTPLPRSPNEMSVGSNKTSAFEPVDRKFFPATVDHVEPNTNGRLLWDFLQQLLNDHLQRYNNYICWKNKDIGVFKIVDPAGLARLWGIQKNHLSMNYDKMSRALRYYYRVNILKKVQGERHCYQFLCNPNELKNIKNISMHRHQTAAAAAAAAAASIALAAQPKSNVSNTSSTSLQSNFNFNSSLTAATSAINSQSSCSSSPTSSSPTTPSTLSGLPVVPSSSSSSSSSSAAATSAASQSSSLITINQAKIKQECEMDANESSETTDNAASVVTATYDEELPFDLRITTHRNNNSIVCNSIKVEE